MVDQSPKRTDDPAGVVCPYCDSITNRVDATRRLPNQTIRRYRVCIDCGRRFCTMESAAADFVDKQPGGSA